jgi:hypothetical protein
LNPDAVFKRLLAQISAALTVLTPRFLIFALVCPGLLLAAAWVPGLAFVAGFLWLGLGLLLWWIGSGWPVTQLRSNVRTTTGYRLGPPIVS